MMSKIAFTPNASGTGTFSIASPGTNTDRTLTLPDATGTVVLADATQTLTNKTISGPTISGATITGSTIQGGAITRGTAVASTSGTVINFTGIPSWAKRVTVLMSGVSTNGASPLIVQLGSSGGVEASGYQSFSACRNTVGTNLSAGISTGGFLTQYLGTASSIFNGTLQISNLTGNVWVGFGVGDDVNGSVSFYSGGKTLSATLDRVRITTATGTDTFDAGTVNIMYEG
jgi:hypothetical protein